MTFAHTTLLQSLHCRHLLKISARFLSLLSWNRKYHLVIMPPTLKKLRGIFIWPCPSVPLHVTFLGACETREWLMLGTWNFIQVSPVITRWSGCTNPDCDIGEARSKFGADWSDFINVDICMGHTYIHVWRDLWMKTMIFHVLFI